MAESSALTLNVGALSTVPLQRVGDVFDSTGGRRFKYVKFTNSSAIAAGAHVYGVVTTSSALALASVANGQKSVDLVGGSQKLVAVATAATTADAYAGGYALVTSGTHKYSLRVLGNTGTTGAGNFVVSFEDSLPDGAVLVPGTDTITLSTCPDNASTTTATGNIDLGYTVNAIAAQTSATYGYTQVSGFSAVSATSVNIQ